MPTDSNVARISTSQPLGNQAYRLLRQMITGGELAAGERLTERALAGRLGVSPTPIREAIQRLEHERLIERRDGRTLTVSEPSARRLWELRLIEAGLRGVAARLAAESATDKELRALAKAHDQAGEALRAAADGSEKSRLKVLELTRAFHRLIDEASHNPVLLDMIATATAFDWTTRANAVKKLGADYPVGGARQEHGALLEALQARDGERAEEVMRAHLIRTGRYLLAYLD